jgi:hypothetical protein
MLGAEVLSETDFVTHAKWAVTNDLDDTGGNLAYTWSANQTSTATQALADFASAMAASYRYRLKYVCAVTTAFDGDGVAQLTTGIASETINLPIVAGTHIVEFNSNADPGDFVIEVISGTDTEGTFTFDNINLKPLNYELVGDLALADGYIDTLSQVMRGFLPATVGATSSTKITDYFYTYFDNLGSGWTEDWRVLRFGGDASSGSAAGVFCVTTYSASSYVGVPVGSRLCF